MKGSLLFILLIFFWFDIYSQERLTSLDEVYVNTLKDSITISGLNQNYNKSEIQKLTPEDIGSMMQKFSGVSLKNYGGIGGLKTISFRGMSGTHTAVVVDGFSMQNNQVGQVDLGTIQSENIESVRLSSAVNSALLAPVSSVLQGNSLLIFTFENSFLASDHQLRVTEKIGSFGLNDSYISYKQKIHRGFISVFSRYRFFQGNYRYNFKNGITDYIGFRNNNDLKEGNAGISFGKIIGKRFKVRSNYLYYGSDKGLPGAVILYNESANQRLNTQNHQWNSDLIYCGKKTSHRIYTSLQMSVLKYSDPSYLNNQGGLHQQYQNKLSLIGYSFNHSLKDSSISWFGGVEYTGSQLKEFSTTLIPKRYHFQAMSGISKTTKNYCASLIVGNHQVFNQLSVKKTYQNAVVGAAEFVVTKQNRWLSQPRIQLKRTFRMPSFGELYYNQIGNVSLLPEIVNQGNIGLTYFFFKNSLQLGIDAYCNLVENKILAIPTKNLFVWSIQNVGKVFISGIDVQLKKSLIMSTLSKIDLRLNYSFQRALDYSDKHSITYKSQIAYIPLHSGNIDISYVQNQKWGVSFNNIIISERFALNENIEANRLKGFAVTDLSMFYLLKSKKSNQYRFSFSVKNLFNSSYAFVRYYMMPGVNYLFTLNYEFN